MFAFFMFIESLHEMESRIQKNFEKFGKDEVCKSRRETAESILVNDIDIQEDKYVAVEEKPCTFKGTFSDSEDELDTEFVYLMLFIIWNFNC